MAGRVRVLAAATAYPKGGGANRPRITGPGLAGPGFYTGGCTRP